MKDLTVKLTVSMGVLTMKLLCGGRLTHSIDY